MLPEGQNRAPLRHIARLSEPRSTAYLRIEVYCETVANITVSVPDDVYRAVRISAAERQTSVSALVRAYLIRIVAQGSEFERLLALQEETIRQIHERGGGFSASERMTRDEVHDRDALR